MFLRNHGRGCVLSSVLPLGSCSQEKELGVLCRGRNSAGEGSVTLPGDCQTAGAERVDGRKKRRDIRHNSLSPTSSYSSCLVHQGWE